MAEKTLIAKMKTDQADGEALLITSPVVGLGDGAPRAGVFLNPFDRIITMKILNVRYVLRLPRNVHGRVTEVFIPNALTPLAYGESIARVDPRVLQTGAEEPGRSAAGESGGENETPDLLSIDAPSDGIFYRRPSPDTAPYVEVGSLVTSGSLLGLVEIMKCFHQITYGGLELPEKGEIVEILAQDAMEVHFGQPLFRIKPVE